MPLAFLAITTGFNHSVGLSTFSMTLLASRSSSAFEVIGVPPKHPTPVAGNVTEFYAFFCFPFDKNQGTDVSV